jgi:hypothetical protein
LKFQYLEQNAKDRYIKAIVSDIDDAPIVSDEDNRKLQAENAVKKEELKASKEALAEVQMNVRNLASSVDNGASGCELNPSCCSLFCDRLPES